MVQGKLELVTIEGTGRRFTAESGSGHVMVLDDAQGTGGPKPIEAALRAIELSETKYCSVSAMMGHTARIEHCFEIEPATDGKKLAGVSE